MRRIADATTTYLGTLHFFPRSVTAVASLIALTILAASSGPLDSGGVQSEVPTDAAYFTGISLVTF
jgi:hypothetical protein